MRALVQTVSRASVTVDDEVVGKIADGLLVLVGVTHEDTATKAAELARKTYELRILDDEASASDIGAPLLVIKQYVKQQGNSRASPEPPSPPPWLRPGWSKARGPAPSRVSAPASRVRGRIRISGLIHLSRSPRASTACRGRPRLARGPMIAARAIASAG